MVDISFGVADEEPLGEVDITSQSNTSMGIDIYAQWESQSEAEQKEQYEGSIQHGGGRHRLFAGGVSRGAVRHPILRSRGVRGW